MPLSLTTALRDHGLLQDIDVRFAGLISRLAGPSPAEPLALAAALVSKSTSDEKHICLDLAAKAGKVLPLLFPEMPEPSRALFSKVKTPDLGLWLEILKSSPCVGAPGEYRPLILDRQNRLYLYRYWDYEHQLVQSLRQRASRPPEAVGDQQMQAALPQLFPGPAAPVDWQKVAACAALLKNFCLITGGPGTGKTRTVSIILALLLAQSPRLRIKLCAPTGKAAARLRESILSTKGRLPCPDRVKHLIPEEASTIHRMLGPRPHSPYFRHNRQTPLKADVVIVDEASMIPLSLMAKLFQALPGHTRIILLGDKDQLASVEAGAVLGDICSAADTPCFSPQFSRSYEKLSGEALPPEHVSVRAAPLADCIVELQHSYRFRTGSGIGPVSTAVNSGRAAHSLALIEKSAAGEIRCRPHPQTGGLEQQLNPVVQSHYAPVSRSRTLEEAFDCLSRFRILCAHRQGRFGVENMNRSVEQILRRLGLIDTGHEFYPGRPLMITSNDSALGLFNGDTGLIRPNRTGELRAWFPDHQESFRDYSPDRLPGHETAYAMTVHKSQGSEFEEILMILPERDSPLLSRELIYTGITRARKRVEIWADEPVFLSAVRRRIERTSGLAEALQTGW